MHTIETRLLRAPNVEEKRDKRWEKRGRQRDVDRRGNER
jgi:hypothetical protein